MSDTVEAVFQKPCARRDTFQARGQVVSARDAVTLDSPRDMLHWPGLLRQGFKEEKSGESMYDILSIHRATAPTAMRVDGQAPPQPVRQWLQHHQGRCPLDAGAPVPLRSRIDRLNPLGVRPRPIPRFRDTRWFEKWQPSGCGQGGTPGRGPGPACNASVARGACPGPPFHWAYDLAAQEC